MRGVTSKITSAVCRLYTALQPGLLPIVRLHNNYAKSRGFADPRLFQHNRCLAVVAGLLQRGQRAPISRDGPELGECLPE